jgi:uncharacterized membrane protein
MSAESTKRRLTYIDCMRGVACILMFQTHAYDSWLGGAARSSTFFHGSQFLSTLAATSFLFLTGVSQALSLDGMARRGATPGAMVEATLRRGGKVFLYALLFRAQEFVYFRSHGPWSNFLRVDVLNVIGVSIALMSLICWIPGRAARAVASAAAALAITMVTPPLWTTWRPSWLPWYLESYINGVHIFNQPQPWLFPIFPWAAFCFAGLAAGILLRSEWAERRRARTMALVALGGLLLGKAALALDALPFQLYSTYDFWHTSPNYFLARLGALLLLLAACYLWSCYAAEGWVFKKIVLLGQNSLLVYWIHISFVYGGLSILPRRASSIPLATLGLLIIIISMTLLATARPWLIAQGTELASRVRAKLLPASEY